MVLKINYKSYSVFGARQSLLDVDLLLEEADNEMYLQKRDKKIMKN